MDSNERFYRVALGPIQQSKIPYGSPYWKEFNSSFENVELPQIGIASALYDGRPITTQHSNHWRTSANYLLGQHIGVDFDTEDKRSSLTTLQADPFIAKYGAILYTTPSHTPDKPRARAMFLLDTPIQQAVNYTLAATALLWVFGSADRQCKDAVRYFYGGRPGACEMEWLGHELPLDLVKDLIKRYQLTGNQARRQVQRKYDPQSTDERDVVSALKSIDAWGIGYDEWLAVLMAIHAEFPGDNGLAIAEAWAQGKNGEVEHKWRGFKTDGNVSGRVGVGTLFAMAGRNGWERQSS